MVRTFRGEFTQKVDGKGRVSIPADFRHELQQGDPAWSEGKAPKFVLVYGDHRRSYLECYTIEAVQQVDEQIADMPRGSIERKMLDKLFHGQSLNLTVDETGRIVLPQRQREKLGLEDQAYFLATGDTFQIWKPETYEVEEVARTEEWLNQFPPDFDILSLLDKGRS